MTLASYIWKVIVSIITVIIVLAVLSIASTHFETAVLSALVLIYISIASFFSLWGLNQLQFGEALDNELNAIKRSIENNNNREDLIQKAESIDQILGIPKEADWEIEVKKEREEKKKVIMVKFYINSAFQFIIFMIAIFSLLSAL